MKAIEAQMLGFLKRSPQFRIPIYQRPYSWGEGECRQLWKDILRSGRSEDVAAHFVGSIVYIEEGLYQVSSQSPLLVIDGQQRLTTVSLILEAVARSLGEEEPVDGFSAEKIRSYYLLNPLEKGDRRFKLLLSQTDEESLLAVVADRDWPERPSERVQANFELFRHLVAGLDGDLTAFCKGLAKLMVVDISLRRDQDNPQLIFESMNSTGKELSQADLIRNFVLMDLEAERQTAVYVEHWRPMELAFGQEAYGKYFDGFMRHYLTLKTGEIPNVAKVYEAFKAFRASPENANREIEELVADVRRYAGFYCAMALGGERDAALADAFSDLRELKVDVAYPFLLELYSDHERELLSREEFLAAVRLVESYVFRRGVCGIPTNSMNKTFAGLGRSLTRSAYLESLEAQLNLLPSYKRFPSDDEFVRELMAKDLYNFRSRSYWLRRLENHGRKERVLVDEYTIEHILPQNRNLNEQWRQSLGPEWRDVQERWLHTLGNLTLSGYNSEYGDRPFAEKRDMEGGFRHSPLRLNQGLGELEEWNEDEIWQRAERLAADAVAVWAFPRLPEEGLEAYVPPALATVTYSISDHPQLAEGKPARALFEAFRKEVKALDETVSEEFLKLYVAYKAETNFVDVVPQATRLRLALNLDFPEVYDPRGVCIDVTDKGRWGNGDVEVHLDAMEQIPYVLGLVRQAFEKQMGGE